MRRLTRTATNGRSIGAPTVNFASFISPTGLYYSYDARLLGSNIIMYSITFSSEYDVASIYDGEDYERSFELFTELSIALVGINYAESIGRRHDELLLSAEELLNSTKVDYSLKIEPLFLGDSENVIC